MRAVDGLARHLVYRRRLPVAFPGNGGSGYDPTFAADGIDELLSGITTRRRLDIPVGHPQTMLVSATDTGDQWLDTLDSDTATTVRSGGPADVVVAADASDLDLTLWNRTGDTTLSVTGDRSVLDTWHRNSRVRWYHSD